MTRFLVIGRALFSSSGDDKTSLFLAGSRRPEHCIFVEPVRSHKDQYDHIESIRHLQGNGGMSFRGYRRAVESRSVVPWRPPSGSVQAGQSAGLLPARCALAEKGLTRGWVQSQSQAVHVM
jgi:hypothetical protein